MSGSSLHPTIAELLDTRRLGSLEASRHRFTVSREEALLRLREQVRARDESRWAWTLALVRAGNALSDQAAAIVRVDEVPGAGEPLRATTIEVITPGAELTGLDLTDMLAGALEPDLGAPLGVELEVEQRQRRFRMLIGRALNAALAHNPVSIELSTVAGGRRFERREQLVEGRDVYVERKLGPSEHASRFIVRLIEPRPGISSRLGAWLRRRGEVGEELAALWQSQRVREGQVQDEDGELLGLAPVLRREPVSLGRHARFGPARGLEGVPAPFASAPMLVRDGVLLLDLSELLRANGLDPVALAGWIDCPSLRLTADERSVARDGNVEQLIAWLTDYQARADEQGRVRWPESLADAPQTANGQPITAEQLAEDEARGRELVYVWRHQAAAVPAHARARIVALWPSQEQLIRAAYPRLRLVPLRALGETGDIDPADLTALANGCYEPLTLAKDTPLVDGDPDSLRVSVDAYVHRARTATTGFVVVLAYERRVAQFNERTIAFAGVTLVCRVSSPNGLDVAALRRDHETLGKVTALCRRKTEDHFEALLAHVMTRANPWENPLLRSALDELGPGTIELRYQQTELGLRLGWRDSVLLGVIVSRTREGQAKTLRDALRTLRERGFVLAGHPLKRYDQIRSSDPLLQPWLLDDEGRALLVRLIGAASLLDMPVVPEAHPLVVEDPLEGQRHLVRGRETIKQWLEVAAGDRLARQRLLGHLLVARGLGGDTLGLETVPLLDRYDPRALSPTRLVSLASVLAEDPRPGLIPAGAVHRGLPRPMLEVTAGLAALLAEVEAFEAGHQGTRVIAIAGEPPPVERSTSTPIRRRARGVAPLLAKSLVHPWVIGRLQVAGDASSEGIGLWSDGLRTGELNFLEPLGRVSGRLLITPAGRRVKPREIEDVVRREARALLADALRQRTLLPPDGPARKRLEHFIEYMRTRVRDKDTFGLAEELGVAEPADPGRRVAMLRAMSLGAAPLRSLGGRRDALLVEVVRQSLALAVHFDTAMLSWRPIKLGKRRRDGSFEIEFGLRNPWIQRGLDEDRQLDDDAHKQAALLAGVFVVAGFFEQARRREDVDVGVEHLVVALWRLLQLGKG